MSTRATITVYDEEDRFHLYLHGDAEPEQVEARIKQAQKYAREPARFNAGDFTAAIIKIMKQQAWGVYLTPDAQFHRDRDYHYKVTTDQGKLSIEVYDRTRFIPLR